MSGSAQALDREELRLLETTARKVFESNAGLEELGELGFTGLLTPESSDGDGWRVVEASVVAKECGRALSRTPWAVTAVAAAAVAAVSDDVAPVRELLAGTSAAALARANAISGRVSVVGAARPEVLLISGTSDLFVVPNASTLTVEEVADGLDTTRELAFITLDGAAGETLTPEDTRRLRAALVLLLCADSVGALSGSVELLTEHLTGRDAFGQPLASFQVIAHRLADLAVLIEAADALTSSAAASSPRGSRTPSNWSNSRTVISRAGAPPRSTTASNSRAASDSLGNGVCITRCAGFSSTRRNIPRIPTSSPSSVR